MPAHLIIHPPPANDMRLDPDLPAESGAPDGGVPSVVYNPPRLPRPPEEITAWTKARWGMYIFFTFLLGMAANVEDAAAAADASRFAGPYGDARADGYLVGGIIGGGLGAVLGTYLLAAAILWWSTRTRRFIPGTAFVFALVTSLDDLPVPDAMDRTGAPAAAVQALAEHPENAPPPQGSKARSQWAMQRAGEDMAAHRLTRAASHGLDLGTAPAGWLSAAYMADAGTHPQVHDYFTRYRQYQQEMDTTSVTVYLDAMGTRLRQSGLGSLQVEGELETVRKEMDGEAPEIRRRSENEHALITAALELHAYLEDVDPRVHLDEGGTVRFARDAERIRAFQLADEVQRRVEVMRTQSAADRASTGP
jgi:hypothetical protein